MKKFSHKIFVIALAAIVMSLSSCGNSNPFGSLPSLMEKYQKAADALNAKAKDIKTADDKAKLIAESQELEKEWTEKFTKASEALNGKTLEVTGDQIEVASPFKLTFEKVVGTSNLAPRFKIEGEAKAAKEIIPDIQFYGTTYNVYLEGYDKDGAEVFSNKVGTIIGEEKDGKKIIPAGTPVSFNSLTLNSSDFAGYQKVDTMKLVVK